MSIAGFDQCANGVAAATDCAGGWINGALQNTNSHYHEDQVVPQRLQISATDNNDHTITISYQDRKGTVHAYDSLATWNTTVGSADPCQALSATICSGATTTYPMMSDTTNIPPADAGISTAVNAHELPATSRNWTVYNGAVTASSAITHDSPLSGDDNAFVTIHFHATGASAGTPKTVLILFGGHLARSGTAADLRAWGTLLGASHVSGGPYHISVGSLDGSGGGPTNSIQAGAVAPGVPNFTITKSANPTSVNAGGTVTYTITVTNTGDGAGAVTFTDNFDDRLTPSAVTTVPTGGTCTREPSGTDRYFTCNTSQLAPGGGQQVFTYTAAMPTSFTTGAGTGNCGATQYPVTNTATLTTSGSASATVCVNAAAAFTINKTANPTTANPGQTVTYTITVTNTGSAPGSTTFTDNYDDRLTPSTVTTVPVGGSCTPDTTGDDVLNCTTSTLAPLGGAQTFTYTATMPATFTGSTGGGTCSSTQYAVLNSATLANTTHSDAQVCVNASPSFTIAKSASPAVTTPGGLVTYTITVTNGGTAAGSTTFVDNYDDRLTPSTVTISGTGGSCTLGTISSGTDKVLNCTTGTINGGGGTQTFSYTANMPATFTGSTSPNCGPGQYAVENSATLANGTSDSARVCVNAAPIFGIDKSSNVTGTTTPGATVTYTITVTNTGTASGSTTFTDDYDDRLTPSSVTTVPVGGTCTPALVGTNKVLNCTTSTLAPLTGSQTFTYTATMPTSFTGASGGGNCPTGSYPVSNGVVLANGGNDSVTVCVAAAPSFTILKSASPTSAVPGQTVTYTITVTNTGTAAGSTTFVDNYDDRLTPSTVTTVPTGGTCTPDTTGDDVLNCTTSTLAGLGGSQTFTYTATMPLTFTTGAGTDGCGATQYPVRNTATLANTTFSSARVCVTAAPAFTIAKTADPTTANPGQTVTYTITVTNTGPAAGSTTFVDNYDDRLTPSTVTTVPAGGTCTPDTTGDDVLNCTTSTLAGLGGSQTFTYTATMPLTFTTGAGTDGCGATQYPVRNTATLANTTFSSARVCVNATPAFTIKKSVTPTSVNAGGTVTYTITVTNGGSAAGSTTFVDDYDDRLTPSSVTTNPTGGSCTPALVGTNKVLNCTTSTINGGGGTQTFTYTATMPASFTGTPGGSPCTSTQYPVSNSATLANGTSDGVTVCVNAAPAFHIDKTVSPTPTTPGATVTYTITVTNSGTAAGSTTFVDNYDDRITPSSVTTNPVGGTCTPGTITGGDKVLNCTTGTINGLGGTQTFTYTATMPTSFTGTSGGGGCATGQFPVTNEATLANGEHDGSTACVTAAPAFTITKTATPNPVAAGGLVTYVVTVTNTGTASGSTSFTDDYDDRITPSAVQSDPAGGTCTPTLDGTNKVLSCTTSTLAGLGGSQSFTYTANMPASFTGTSGGGNCPTGSYPVSNRATLANGGASAPVTVCVTAAPQFTILKSADPSTASPGQLVTYTITVTNTGTASGSTPFTDNYDDRITPSSVTTNPTGGSCTPTTLTGGDKVLACQTGTIAGLGGFQTFTYTATMPTSFTTGNGDGGCANGQYPVTNRANLPGGDPVGATVCVNAAPAFTIAKSASPTTVNAGGSVTYTIVVTNSGTASGSTTFVDDYDDRLTPSSVTVSGTGGSCTPAVVSGNKVLNCTTGTINGLGGTQTFTYTANMPATFTGTPGGSGCTTSPSQYPVSNQVKLANGTTDGVTVCVNAAPDFAIAKSAPATANPGQTVTYVVTVTNNGTASGSTTFVDNYDDRLTPSSVTVSGTGGSCTPGTLTGGDKVLNCTTGTIAPAGGTQTFTYTAVLPSTFSGSAGGAGCSTRNPQQYPITNVAALANGRSAPATVCVNAAPVAVVTKSVQIQNTTDGGQVLVYTINYQNTGAAASMSTIITDTIPTGTRFVSCVGCTPVGSPTVTSVTWSVGGMPAHSAGDPVTFTVLVTATQQCSISNTAYVQFDDYPPTASNTTVTAINPVSDPSGAHSSGYGIGAQVTTSGLLGIDTGPISYAASSKSGPGDPTFGYDQVAGLSVPGSGKILRTGILTTTSASGVFSVPPVSRQISSAEVAGVCVVPINGLCTVSADVVRAVASTIATGQYATYGSQGSTITNLKVLGLVTPVDLNQTTKIDLPALVFGAGSYVAIGERTASAGLVGNSYVADLSVTMIHVKITGLLTLQAANVIVARAVAHSDFPKTLECGALRPTVSGHAFLAQLTTAPQLVDLTQGYVAIPSTGGYEAQHIAQVKVALAGKAVVAAMAGDTRSYSAFDATQVYEQSSAELAGDLNTPACVIQLPTMCVVSATLIHTQAQTLGTASGVTSTDAGTQLVGLKVLGIPISANVAPNTTIALPGIGYLVLNEQFCDNGALAFHTCTGTTHSGLTVRAIDLVVNGLSNPSGLPPAIQLIVAESHSDATWHAAS